MSRGRQKNFWVPDMDPFGIAYRPYFDSRRPLFEASKYKSASSVSIQMKQKKMIERHQGVKFLYNFRYLRKLVLL